MMVSCLAVKHVKTASIKQKQKQREKKTANSNGWVKRKTNKWKGQRTIWNGTVKILHGRLGLVDLSFIMGWFAEWADWIGELVLLPVYLFRTNSFDVVQCTPSHHRHHHVAITTPSAPKSKIKPRKNRWNWTNAKE